MGGPGPISTGADGVGDEFRKIWRAIGAIRSAPKTRLSDDGQYRYFDFSAHKFLAKAGDDVHLEAGDDVELIAAEDINQTAGDDITLTAGDSIDVTYVGHMTIPGTNLRVPSLPTTGSSANVFVTAVGTPGEELRRSTSSLRYKTDVEDAVIDPVDVLALRPRVWHDKNDVANANEGDVLPTYTGFIAEELDELETMRQFVVYDQEGRPDAISYDRLAAALLVVVQDLTARVSQLEGQS